MFAKRSPHASQKEPETADSTEARPCFPHRAGLISWVDATARVAGRNTLLNVETKARARIHVGMLAPVYRPGQVSVMAIEGWLELDNAFGHGCLLNTTHHDSVLRAWVISAPALCTVWEQTRREGVPNSHCIIYFNKL
jgi:hypothetical protein